MNWFHDTERNLLIYPNCSPLIWQYLPEAREVGGYAAVPFNLANAQTLRGLNFPVPPVITDENYDWPRMPGITPYATQKLQANFMVLHPKCLNLSSMGTGKTYSVLWAADWLLSNKHIERALLIAPLSVLQRVWGDAIFKNFMARRTFQILYGSADKRKQLLDIPADFYVINFEGVSIGAHTLMKMELDGLSKLIAGRNDIQLIVADEASAYRDSQSKRSRISRMVFGDRKYQWFLTGTPTPNAPTDAYGLAKMVNGAFGKSFRTFRSETMYQLAPFKWVPQRDGYDKARRILTPSIHIDIKDVWDAPPLTTQQREVALTPAQHKAMTSLKKDFQVEVKSGHPITAANEASVRTKFIQIALGAIYDGEHNVHLIDSEPRLSECEDVIENANRKVLIFVPLTSVIDLLYKRLSKRWKCGVLNGAVHPTQRAQTIKDFETDPDMSVMIADPQTTSHGINSFTVADTVLFYGPTEKNELYLQGVKRIDRPGQKYPMTVIQLVSTPLEREIFKRLENQTSLQGMLLEMVKRGEL